MGADHVQDVRRKAPGNAHFLDFVACLNGYGHGREYYQRARSGVNEVFSSDTDTYR
jgi:hypothetical protein